MLQRSEMETITAAALRHDGLTVHMPPPARHGDLIDKCHKVGWPEGAHGEQGFFTSENRFVDRAEAYRIALAAHQMVRRTSYGADELYSEDLW